MRKRLLVIPMAMALICSFADAQRLSCEDAWKNRVGSWDALHRWYKLYGRCNDGANGEASSEYVARILVDHWATLPRLARLAGGDPGFRAFVIAGVNATLDMSDVKQIEVKAKTCPKNLAQLCADLSKQADLAINQSAK